MKIETALRWLPITTFFHGMYVGLLILCFINQYIRIGIVIGIMATLHSIYGVYSMETLRGFYKEINAKENTKGDKR